MQSTFGRSPSPTSYSKSTTTMVRKTASRPDGRTHDRFWRRTDQAEQCRMIVGFYGDAAGT